jgi:hypothetical protein
MDDDDCHTIFHSEFHAVSRCRVGRELQEICSKEERRGFVERLAPNVWGIEDQPGG